MVFFQFFVKQAEEKGDINALLALTGLAASRELVQRDFIQERLNWSHGVMIICIISIGIQERRLTREDESETALCTCIISVLIKS